eukprot:4577290-Amphidinium_carterae.1
MRFRRASESRWVTIGEACRTITAARLCGLDGLLEQVRAVPGTSDFYLGGVTRMTPDVAAY